MPNVEINYWVVLIATVINMAVGFFWYSKGAFGARWSKLTGVSMDDMKKRGNSGIAVSVVTSLITAFVLAHFVRYAGATSFADGLVTGFWLWLGFVAAMLASSYVFEGRPWKLWQINAGYWLVVLLINSGLLASWR